MGKGVDWQKDKEDQPMKRHEMSDEQWTALEPLLPVNIGRGRRWTDHRQVINGILWVLNTGAAWRDMPERFGPWHRPLADDLSPVQ